MGEECSLLRRAVEGASPYGGDGDGGIETDAVREGRERSFDSGFAYAQDDRAGGGRQRVPAAGRGEGYVILFFNRKA